MSVTAESLLPRNPLMTTSRFDAKCNPAATAWSTRRAGRPIPIRSDTAGIPPWQCAPTVERAPAAVGRAGPGVPRDGHGTWARHRQVSWSYMMRNAPRPCGSFVALVRAK
jgi:hypothetical protein